MKRLNDLSDTYGRKYGMFAAVLHYYMVTTVPNLHGGFCLYSGGFTAALVCILLIPPLEHHFKHTMLSLFPKIKFD